MVAERVERYRELVADGSTIPEATREAVLYAAARVPTAIVSGAALAEILPVVRAAGLDSAFAAIVSADAVTRGKPHPEGYLRALELLGAPAAETVAFEDTESGIASATGAGMRCIAVRGTLAPGPSREGGGAGRSDRRRRPRAPLRAVTRPFVIAHRGASAACAREHC